MEQLQQAAKAYRQNNEIIFENRDGVKVLNLVLNDAPFDEVIEPRISADENEWHMITIFCDLYSIIIGIN